MWIEVFLLTKMFIQTAYMKRMITQVSKKLGWFMVVLAIIVIGFANCFLILSKVEDSFIIRDNDVLLAIEYTYKICLASFDTDNFPKGNYNYVASFVWLLSTFMLLLVMLNMIIGLINSIFSEINEDSLCHAYKELVSIMRDNKIVMNTEKLFRNMKYMIVINNEELDKHMGVPETSIKVLIDQIEQDNQNVAREFEGFENNIKKSIRGKIKNVRDQFQKNAMDKLICVDHNLNDFIEQIEVKSKQMQELDTLITSRYTNGD